MGGLLQWLSKAAAYCAGSDWPARPDLSREPVLDLRGKLRGVGADKLPSAKQVIDKHAAFENWCNLHNRSPRDEQAWLDWLDATYPKPAIRFDLDEIGKYDGYKTVFADGMPVPIGNPEVIGKPTPAAQVRGLLELTDEVMPDGSVQKLRDLPMPATGIVVENCTFTNEPMGALFIGGSGYLTKAHLRAGKALLEANPDPRYEGVPIEQVYAPENEIRADRKAEPVKGRRSYEINGRGVVVDAFGQPLVCYGCAHSAAVMQQWSPEGPGEGPVLNAFPGKPSGERPCCFCIRNVEREKWKESEAAVAKKAGVKVEDGPYAGVWYDGSRAWKVPMDCYRSTDMLRQEHIWSGGSKDDVLFG